MAYRVIGPRARCQHAIDFHQDNKVFIAPSFTGRAHAGHDLHVPVEPLPEDRQQGLPTIRPRRRLAVLQSQRPDSLQPLSRRAGGRRLQAGAIRQSATRSSTASTRFSSSGRTCVSSRRRTTLRPPASIACLPMRDARTVRCSMCLQKARNLAVDNQLQADFFTGPFEHKVLAGVDYIHTKSHSRLSLQRMADRSTCFRRATARPFHRPRSLTPFMLQRRHAGPDRRLSSGPDQVRPLHAHAHRPSRQGEHGNLRSPCDNSENPGRPRETRAAWALAICSISGLPPTSAIRPRSMPVLGSDRLGNPFKPTTGEGKEIGVKYQAPGSNLLFTAAAVRHQAAERADRRSRSHPFQRADRRSAGAGLRVRGARQRHAQPRDRRRL